MADRIILCNMCMWIGPRTRSSVGVQVVSVSMESPWGRLFRLWRIAIGVPVMLAHWAGVRVEANGIGSVAPAADPDIGCGHNCLKIICISYRVEFQQIEVDRAFSDQFLRKRLM